MRATRISRIIRRIVLGAGLLPTGACVSGDGCGPIQRLLTATGEIRDGTALIATVTVTVVEQRGDPRVVRAEVAGARGPSGAPLRGHVLAARLVNAANGDTIRVFRLLPADPGGDGDVIDFPPVSAGDDLKPIKRMLRRRRGVLLLDTDLPGRERITVPLTGVHVGGWVRAECG
jgi:hypothetical protein